MNANRYAFLLCLLILNACSTIHTAKIEPNQYAINASTEVAEEPSIAALIEPFKNQLDAEMNQVIGQAAKELTKKKPESTLGNWMADLLYEKTVEYYGQPVDVSLVNYGGVRIPAISSGNITRSRIFELMPFDNQMVVVHVDGPNFLKLCNRMADAGGWPISRHLRFEIVDGQAKNIEINGQPFQQDRTYKVSLSDYIANGGDQCFFLKELPRDDLNHLVRDAILEFVTEKGTEGIIQDAELDGRTR